MFKRENDSQAKVFFVVNLFLTPKAVSTLLCPKLFTQKFCSVSLSENLPKTYQVPGTIIDTGGTNISKTLDLLIFP